MIIKSILLLVSYVDKNVKKVYNNQGLKSGLNNLAHFVVNDTLK